MISNRAERCEKENQRTTQDQDDQGKKDKTKYKGDNKGAGRRVRDSLWEDPNEITRENLMRLFDGSRSGEELSECL